MSGKKLNPGKIILSVFLVIIFASVLSGIIVAFINPISINSTLELIASVPPVENADIILPEKDSQGNYYYKTDRELKIMQLTDIHIGGGCFSAGRDALAINAVASMVTADKPDLVVITGDMVFPIPVLAGTMNNLRSVKIVAALFEQLGVPWIPVFGNHDSEIYNYARREEVADYLESSELSHCIFRKGSPDIDGYGNSVIKIKDTDDNVTHSLFFLDSHEYTDDDPLGIKWNYDNIHQNQIDWYSNTVKKINSENTNEAPVTSLLFFHIPTAEFRDAWQEYSAGEEDAELIYGTVGEKGGAISCPRYEDNLFDTMQSLEGRKGIYCGHDHLNNFSMNYKGVQLTYGNSIDYLAYADINKLGSQRGCTLITLEPDGSFNTESSNYYQDKYKPVTGMAKEAVTMQDMAANRDR